MPDITDVTVTVTTPDGVTRIMPAATMHTTPGDVEWDEYPQADGSILAVPRPQE